MTVLVSVVIATYQRPQLLDRCLQALLAQNFNPALYEIIVVDDGPEDEATRLRVAEWQQRLQTSSDLLGRPARQAPGQDVPKSMVELEEDLVPITGRAGAPSTEVIYRVRAPEVQYPRLYYLPAYHTRGPAAARNIGWRFASGPIIAFTDDDCIPDPMWLFNGVAAFQGNVVGVSGRVVVPLPECPTDNDLNTTGLERSDFVTANCFYRKCVLEEVGGFDERFSMAWREDSDLYFTLRDREYTLAWAADSIVLHPVRPERWGSSIRNQKKSFFNALLFKKHPRLYWQIIQPSPPWKFYLMAFLALWGVAGMVFSLPWLAAACWGGWLVLVGQFAWQRLRNTARTREHVLEMLATSAVIPFLSIYWRIRGAIHWGAFFL